MKYILSNWIGYEIDSSEFAASISPYNVYDTIKAFLNSSSIKSYSGYNLIDNLGKAINIAKFENEEKYNEIRINGSNLDSYYSSIKDWSEKDLTKAQVLELVEAINFFVHNYPFLIFEFLESVIYFNRKGEQSTNYELSVVGFPRTFIVEWYDEEGWKKILEAVRRRGSFAYKYWL